MLKISLYSKGGNMTTAIIIIIILAIISIILVIRNIQLTYEVDRLRMEVYYVMKSIEKFLNEEINRNTLNNLIRRDKDETRFN